MWLCVYSVKKCRVKPYSSCHRISRFCWWASVGMAVRTVGVSFEKLVPDAAHVSAIRGAVERVHRCTLLATRSSTD